MKRMKKLISCVWREDDDDKEFMVGLFTQTLAQGVLNEDSLRKEHKTGNLSVSP